jgi:beta-glucoside operon transcriptional antiterminator
MARTWRNRDNQPQEQTVITVKKSLNNSMLLVENEQEEMVLFGKGLGFNAKPGMQIDIAHVEKVFIPIQDLKSRHFLSLTATIPAAFFDVTHDIIQLAQQSYVKKLHSSLFFTLTEHLFFAAERCKKEQSFVNKLGWEIKRYYQKEYEIARQASAMVSARFDISLPADEAVNIAFHLINASGDNDTTTAHQQVELVNRIAEIVRYKLNKILDIDSVNYNRFITHVRYFAERILSGKIAASDTEDFYQELLRHRPGAMAVSLSIRDYVQEKYAIALPKDELTWLSLHISRLEDGGA